MSTPTPSRTPTTRRPDSPGAGIRAGGPQPAEPQSVEPQPAAKQYSAAEAYRYCARLARSHYENFNVGGCITPKDKMPHVYAIYAWCRTVDDLGDEDVPYETQTPAAAPGRPDPAIAAHRLDRLDWWEGELNAAFRGQARHPVAVAVQHTVATFSIPCEPFLKLIHANRMDQGAGRFTTMAEVLDYCDYSANPVGRLCLYLFGYSDPERQRLADHTCTALQLTNFWQDVARDYHERGRIYIPTSDLAEYGVAESEIATGIASPAFKALLRRECGLAMDLFREGAPLASSLRREARLPVALFTRGGVAVLDAIRHADYDVLQRRPTLSKAQKLRLLCSAWFRSRMRLGYGLPAGPVAP